MKKALIFFLTIVPIKLEAYESGFVVFKNKLNTSRPHNNVENFPVAKVITTISTPWKVTFDTAMRGPSKPVVFNKLADWITSNNEQIKNYSRTTIYQTKFDVNNIPPSNNIYLNLGVVKVMAKVKVNGKDVGTVWTVPFKVDVTNAIKNGRNKVEIEVVNTWVNRLIGDSKLPEAERKTWSNVNNYTPKSKYQPSGLIGPVKVEAVKF